MQLEWDGFREEWKKRFGHIRTQPFSYDQCKKIHLEFFDEFFTVYAVWVFSNKKLSEYRSLNTDLTLALETAYSRYRDGHKNFWSRIFGGKKELNLVKIK